MSIKVYVPHQYCDVPHQYCDVPHQYCDTESYGRAYAVKELAQSGTHRDEGTSGSSVHMSGSALFRITM